MKKHLLLAFTAVFILVAACLQAQRFTAESVQVLDGILYKDIVLFPIRFIGATEPAKELEFLLLDEGIADGSVLIREVGGEDDTHANVLTDPADQEVPDSVDNVQIQTQMIATVGARVNTIVIQNNSPLPLFLMAGEIIRGAKQDRIIAHDIVIPPKSAELPVDVFCVEPDRWHGETMEFTSANTVAGGKIRASAQSSKSQQDVWDNVARYNKTLGVEAETGTLQAAFDSDELSATLEEYRRNLMPALVKVEGISGVIVAAHNEIIAADLFGSRRLFDGLSVKLLSSYVLDMATGEQNTSESISRLEARVFIEKAFSAKSTQEYTDGSFSTEQIHGKTAGAARSLYQGTEIHLNVF